MLLKKHSENNRQQKSHSSGNQKNLSRKPRPSLEDNKSFLADFQSIVKDKKNEKKYKLHYTIRDDLFINNMKSFILKTHNPQPEEPPKSKESILVEGAKRNLSKLIEDLQSELEQQQLKTDQDLIELNRKMEFEMNGELYFEGNYRSDHLLKDLQYRFEDEVKFLDHMEFKQQTSVLMNMQNCQNPKDRFVFPDKERPKKSEDYVCQICSDGDYTDSNQIVFCARCNISFHQRCYGIHQIPEGNWICDLCKYHGPSGRFMRCALCSRKGGCLRRINIPARSDFWKGRNGSYADYAGKKCVNVSPEEPPVMYQNGHALIEDDVSVNSENFEEFLYYDYYKELDKSKPVDFESEPATHLTWVHLSCCFWIPKIEISEDDTPNMVHSLDTVDRKRFQMECSICGKREGACIQCSARNCQEPFHVECARRTKMFMETKNSENRFYTVYCDRHAPLMAKRKLDSQGNSLCSDITKFCRYIEKFYESYRYKFEDVPREEETPAYVRLMNKKKAEKNNENSVENGLLKNSFIREVRHELFKFPDYGNVIIINKDEDGAACQAEYAPPRKVFLRSVIHKTHKVWNNLAKVHAWPYGNIYKKFKRVLMGSTESPLEGLIKPKQEKRTKDWNVEGGVMFVQNQEGRRWFI